MRSSHLSSIMPVPALRSLSGIAGALAAILLVLSPLAITPATARETVAASGYAPGTIVVHTNERRLYYYLAGGKALRYGAA